MIDVETAIRIRDRDRADGDHLGKLALDLETRAKTMLGRDYERAIAQAERWRFGQCMYYAAAKAVADAAGIPEFGDP